MAPHSDRITLAVVGADTAVGAEVARLGVAIDFKVVGYAEAGAPTDEPWTHGVEWRAYPASWSEQELAEVDAIVLGDRPIDPDLRVIASRQGIRFVVIGGSGTSNFGENEVILEPGTYAPASDVMAANVGGVFLEHVAMAALRCSVEEDRHGIYGPEEISHIGDAVMIQ